MNETDLFNKDAMYWREVNFLSPNAKAILTLIEPMTINGTTTNSIECTLLPYEVHSVEYDLGAGGSFLKNEVKTWPFVLFTDIEFYLDMDNPEDERQTKVQSVLHDNVQSIQILDKDDKVVLDKKKV
ncbi:hypothetical protein DNU06_05920 [Putridiphycobacter roseus]|uniref:Uncharacterized protein n=1 Tax=Putridiphycobacter roseus TaxID=2219161 RepID=A0A2W1NRB6_9FLAO|nr:hypothetical protein [Putridiphycobacter roseus]PZE18152.1 hypothetical protein DNU06_05920 [Putridiphycobacter roseus]